MDSSLKALSLPVSRQVRAAAHVQELALAVQADAVDVLVADQVVDHLDLVRLAEALRTGPSPPRRAARSAGWAGLSATILAISASILARSSCADRARAGRSRSRSRTGSRPSAPGRWCTARPRPYSRTIAWAITWAAVWRRTSRAARSRSVRMLELVRPVGQAADPGRGVRHRPPPPRRPWPDA